MRGGKREGAGRKPKDRTPKDGQRFETAEEYLEAVVKGAVAPHALRLSAAKCLIAYQSKKQRAPKKSPPPADLERAEVIAAESVAAEAFEQVAERIRAKHGRLKKCQK